MVAEEGWKHTGWLQMKGERVASRTHGARRGGSRCIWHHRRCNFVQVSEQTLTALGIETCGDIIKRRATVLALLGETSARFLFRSALGIGASRHPGVLCVESAGIAISRHSCVLLTSVSSACLDHLAREGSSSHAEPSPPGAVGRKGMSVERTFRAISDPSEMESMLRALVAKLCEGLEREGLRGRTLTLKLKTSGFETRTRSVSLPR